MRNVGIAYLLWLTGLLGIAGTHRFYNGKYVSGTIWLFTFGLFGFGQLIDLALIPGMVEEKNLKYSTLYGSPITNNQTVVVNVADYITPSVSASQASPAQSDIQIILQLAKNSSGGVSIADCVIATGKPIEEVKKTLLELSTQGLLEVANRQDNGAIVYRIG